MPTQSLYLSDYEMYRLLDYIQKKGLTKYTTNEVIRKIIVKFLKEEGFLDGKNRYD